jgi:hypothetical protein
MRPRDARLLDAAFAAASPALFGIALLQHVAVPILAPMAGLPRWLAGAWVVLWLGGTLLLARIASARGRWSVALVASATMALAAAGMAFAGAVGWRHGAAWLMVAFALAALAAVVARWQSKPVRKRAREETGEPARAADARGAPWPAFGASAFVFVDGFLRSLGGPEDGQRGAGMLLMLVAFFVLLPAASLAPWHPRASRATWWSGALAGLAVVTTVATPTATGLASAALACAVGVWIGRTAGARQPAVRGAPRRAG